VAIHWNTFGNLKGVLASMTGSSSSLIGCTALHRQRQRVDPRGSARLANETSLLRPGVGGSSLSNHPTPLCGSSGATMNRDKKPSLLVVRHEFVTPSLGFLFLLGIQPAKPEPIISTVHTRIESPSFGRSLARKTALRRVSATIARVSRA
jgi:hypothetical protein